MSKRIGDVDTPITEIELEHGISAGIQQRIGASGLVSTYEEHEARLTRGYNVNDWYALDPLERAICVAQLRISRAMENQQAEAEIRHSKMEAARGKR